MKRAIVILAAKATGYVILPVVAVGGWSWQGRDEVAFLIYWPGTGLTLEAFIIGVVGDIPTAILAPGLFVRH